MRGVFSGNAPMASLIASVLQMLAQNSAARERVGLCLPPPGVVAEPRLPALDSREAAAGSAGGGPFGGVGLWAPDWRDCSGGGAGSRRPLAPARA
mgnify:CR=1 FL=1